MAVSQTGREHNTYVHTYMHTISACTNTHMWHTCVDAGLILEVASIFQCPLSPVVPHRLKTIHKHKHRFIEMCLKFTAKNIRYF